MLSKNQIKEFLTNIENKYSDDEYLNVVGTKSELFRFMNYAKKHDIWTYKVCTFTVYYGTQFKVVFCKKKDLQKIKKFTDNSYGLCLNASNPFC